MLNAMTIDFEYYRMDAGLNIRTQLREFLDLLDRYDTRCSFFVMGDLFEKQPELVRNVAERGHEIGYHTHLHPLVTDADVLKSEIERSAGFISKFAPKIFRAPMIYLTEDCFEILEKNGFTTDSSSYGDFSHVGRIGGVTEIPVSAIEFNSPDSPFKGVSFPRDFKRSIRNHDVPIGSSFFLSLFGGQYTRVLHWLNARRRPAVFFLHSWQLDPRITFQTATASLLRGEPAQIVYSRNLLGAVESLLKRFRFGRLSELGSGLS